jgi:23S rRNA-/tRNA-specific pseudouridylate synthase
MSIAPDRILYEDEHLLAVNKLSGELVVKGAGKVQKLPLFDFLQTDYPGLRVLHRLDFETSGVVLFAKTKEAEAKVLNTKFEQWEKTYQCLVMGRINRPSGVIRKKLPARGKGVVDAETLYKVLDVFANSSYVECVITTGRFNQISKPFAGIEHPLVLDKEYGHPKFNQLFKQELGYNKFFLHSTSLSFPHPITGKDMVIDAPLPKAFSTLIKKLRSL